MDAGKRKKEVCVCVEKDWSGCWLVVQKRRGMNE